MKDAIAKAYVRYGMHVFEHEHAKKERIRENQADEAELEQAQGGKPQEMPQRGGTTNNDIGCQLRSDR